MNIEKETPWRFIRKWHKKWKVIDKSRYPNNGIVIGDIFREDSCQKFIGYMKNDILCFYWGIRKSKFNKMDYGNIIFTLHRESFNKIKQWIDETEYKGKIAFELCELEQLNKVIEYMIQRQGYKTYREGEFLFILNKSEAL